jgi:hypothetical protein
MDFGGSEKPNSYLHAKIVAAMCSYTNGNLHSSSTTIDNSRLELDSHANMPIVGCESLVIDDLGVNVDVSPFSPDYPSMQVKLVDAVVQYDCPFSGRVFMLLIHNAIYVPAMTNNLIPPFVLREAGITVNDAPKIQVKDPTVQDHALIFPETDFFIPLKLWGIFSNFSTSKPSVTDFENTDDLYTLTPTKFNPHSTSYAKNEANMVDWEGNMIEKRYRDPILLEEVPDDLVMASALQIGAAEGAAIDRLLPGFDAQGEELEKHQVPFAADEVTRGLLGMSPLLSEENLHTRLAAQGRLGRDQMAIGATTVNKLKYLLDDDYHIDVSEERGEVVVESEEGYDQLFQDSVSGKVYLDAYMVSAVHARPKMDVDAEHLSKIWRIDLETAQRTLEVTSQLKEHAPLTTLPRNYSTNDRMLRYKRINEHFFMDTFFATKNAKKGGKSSRGYTCCQLFVTDKGFVYVVPMMSKSEVLQAVKQFAKEIGAPEAIISDPSEEQTSSALRQFCQEIGTTLRALEEGTQWANQAELYIGLIKEAVRQDMKQADCPLVFWDNCVERRARINNVTAKSLFQLHGSNAHTATLQEEADISNIARYGWYEWCYYRDHTAPFPHPREVLGRVLGPARGAGNEMSQWILRANGKVVPCRTVRPLREDEKRDAGVIKQQKLFDSLIERRWGTSINPPSSEPTEEDDLETDEDEPEKPTIDIEDSVDGKGKLINQQPAWDRMLQAEIAINKGTPAGPAVCKGTVKQRAIAPTGKTMGTYDQNPLMNTMVYEVEFEDGDIVEYSANSIADNMLRQIDSEGFSITMLAGIVDFKKDETVAVSKSDGWVVTKRGNKKKRKTTQGWKLLVRWKDDSETWVPLKDIRASFPIEVAEFARARGIDEEPAFAWWVPYTLRKRDVIISAVKCRAKQATHKYGVEIPRSVEQAYNIDKKNGNTHWADAIGKEMLNVGIAFEVLESSKATPVGWSKVTGHMVFDVKMDFTRKARWVLDGHRSWLDLCRSCVQRKCQNCPDLCSIEWSTSVCCRHSECLPTSSKLAERFYYLWIRIWAGECWQKSSYPLSLIWRKSCWA